MDVTAPTIPDPTNATIADLRNLVNEMVGTIVGLIQGCADQEVTWMPEDPDAYDPVAATPEEIYLPWTLGHVIAHITATWEENATMASELARGVQRGGRSRREVPWRTMTTVEQCLHRLEESRRIRLASLEMWPDQPYLDTTLRPGEDAEPMNAITFFLLAHRHDQSHLNQISRLIQQSRQARTSGDRT